MKNNQEHVPKYWVIHNPRSSEVYLDTANKSRCHCIYNFNESGRASHEDFDEQVEKGIVACDLIEICFANLGD